MPATDPRGTSDSRSPSEVSRARAAEAQAEAQSGRLTRVLGLGDVTLAQIVFVVGVSWVGTAAKLGHQQLFFWLAAVLLFYLPQAAVVIYLTRHMPFEGGLYQWAKISLGDAMGFMVGWNLWLFAVVLLSSIGLVVSTNLSYVVGDSGAWMATSQHFITGTNIAIIGGLALLATLGLGVARWVHNAGGLALMSAFAVLIALPFVHAAHGTLPPYHPLAATAPALTLLSLNIFGKLAVGALSGFEYVAVLAGECRDPAKTIGRGTMIAAPIIALMFILGTSAVLAFVTPEHVNLIGPIPQVLRLGFSASGLGAIIAPAAILLLTMRTLANSSIVFTTTTRLPLVAGWDRLLPDWFTRVHPTLGTPVNSILVVAVASMVFGLAGLAGVHEQEAFQLLDNASGVFYGLTYLVLFALPLVGLRAGARPPRWLRVASACGFAVTLLYIVLSVFPIIDVQSWTAFAAKISGVIVGCNLLGYILYKMQGHRGH